MSSSPKLTEKQTHFFSSFTMLDYASQTLKWAVTDDSLFGTSASGPLQTIPVKESKDVDKGYQSFDNAHNLSYAIAAYHLSRYYWSNNDSIFWAQRMTGHVSLQDSIIYQRRVHNGDVPGIEWMVIPHGTTVRNRQRLMLYDNEIYSIFVNGTPEDLTGTDVNRFFDDFRFQRAAPHASAMLVDKSAALLKDLRSDDTARAAQALSYLPTAPFTREDLPLLEQALLQSTYSKAGN